MEFLSSSSIWDLVGFSAIVGMAVGYVIGYNQGKKSTANNKPHGSDAPAEPMDDFEFQKRLNDEISKVLVLRYGKSEVANGVKIIFRKGFMDGALYAKTILEPPLNSPE